MGVKPLWLAGIQLMIKLIRINYVGKLKKNSSKFNNFII